MESTFRVINRMQSEGIIGKYAIGGAIGATFYLEPTSTFDIDVFISFKNVPPGSFISLAEIYSYLNKLGYKAESEHMMIEGWQVQFLPADDQLYSEALEQAVQTTLGSTPIWVMRAEHLIAIALRLGRGKDLIRIEQFVTSQAFDPDILHQILARHQLTEKWEKFKARYINP